MSTEKTWRWYDILLLVVGLELLLMAAVTFIGFWCNWRFGPWLTVGLITSILYLILVITVERTRKPNRGGIPGGLWLCIWAGGW